MAQFRDANEAKEVLKQMQKVEQDYGAPPSGGSPSSAIQHAIDNAKRFESWQDSLSKVMQSFQSFNDEQGDRWTEDASGGTVESMRSLMKQYEDAYSESVYSFGNLENAYKALKDSVSWIDQRNSFMSQFNSQEDYDRNRSGYINYGVGYTPQNWNLTDDDARAIRTQQAKADKEAASQAKAEYEAADSAFRKINNAYAMAINNRYAGTYDEEKSKALHDEYIAAKDRVQQAKAAYDDIQNRLDAYNAGWGKVDQYADVISASKGTKGSYQGPGYEELTAWNRGRQQDMLDQQMAAFRDDAPPAQGSSPDNMPAVNDKLGFWLSLTPEQREEEVFTSGNAKHWGNLTEGEISAYYYLIQNRGQEAADKYLDDMTAELGRREDAKFIEKVENANGLALAGYNALSVAENVLGALPSAAEKAGELITGKDNPYSNVQGLQRRAQYIRGVTGQRLDDSVADSQWLQDKVGEQWANRVGNLANQTYQAMMSGVDSAAGALLFGPGAGFGVGPFTMHLGGYSTVMGMGAFAQRAQELQAMGASREQMAVGAVGAGILESIFEDISAEAFFGNVLDNPDAAFVKKLLTQMGVEASEEVCTEIGNMALDAINLGRKSDNQRRILEYVASGLSYEDAVREATRDAAMDIFWAGYGGAVSAGGMTAVGHSVSSAVSNVDAARSNYYVGSRLFESGDAGALVEQAQGITDTKARKKLVEQAQRVQKNQASGNDSFADKMDTGKVANRIARQAQKEGADAKRSAFQAIARDYLTGQENIGNKKLAEKVLTKAYMGDNFLPGEKGYYNILGGEKLLNAVLDSVPAGALESDMEARQQKSARTVMGTLGAVTGSKSVTEFSKTFDSRNDGMAYRKDSHDPVNIRGISRMQGGKLYLQTDSGEVLADNMIYGNYGEAKLFKVISAMDIDTAGAQKVLGMVENTQLETGDFADAMQNAYMDGYTGVEFDRINRSSLAGQLTQGQRRLAWEAGKQARAAQIGSMVRTVDSRKMATAKGGLKIADNVDLSNLNKAQESALAFIRALSESGVPVEVYASTEAERAAGAANGSFSPDGSIRIDINAGDNGQGAAAYALAHEITHFTEIYSPEKFQNLADLLIREAGENGISWENMLKAKTAQLREQKQYAGLEEQKLADLARSECIAEMCETILTDTDAAARLSRKLQSQDKSLWEKIKDFFTGLVEKLKEAYADMNPDSRIARSMKAAVTQNEAVLNAWVDAVSDGVENFRMQDGQKKNAQEGVRYSLRGTTDGQTVAVVDEDILSNIDLTQWDKQTKKEVKAAAKEALKKFSNGIVVDGITRSVNKVSRNEYTGSKYSEKISKTMPQLYADKMRAASAIDDVVIATTDWARDGKLLHPRTDDFVDFDHGKVLIEAGKNQYSAEVVVGITDRGNAVFYDVVDIQPTQFTTIKEEPSPNVTTNKSPDIAYESSPENRVPQQATEVKENVRYSSRNQTESDNFKRWFGDWQNDPQNASKVVNRDGTPMVLYHQTASDFTIFDPKYPGAGTRDNETPFGIFMKSSDKNIGLNGDKQMALYARIVNPLEVQDRQHLTRELEKISPDFSEISEEYRNLNEEYQRKVDDAGEAVRAHMLEWRKAHPDASRRAIYEDARYNELSDAEDALIDEWEEEAKKMEARSKEIITRDLESNGYDGVIILYDKGSFGRSTDAYIALHPEQVKSATGNIGTFDRSNPDIRYSSRTNQNSALSRLEKQNERLQEEMDYLKQLVKIQKSGNKDFILDRNSVKKQAGKLMDAVNAKGDREALSRMLNDFYHRMHTDSEITWDAMQEDAGAIADWLLEHHQAQRDEYAQNILDFLKKRRVKLSESQVGDIEYSYGSLSDFKRAIKGSIILDQSSNTSLDQLWQEAAAQFPDQFAADAVDADMPDRLADIVRWANSSESSAESEFQYNVAEYRNDLMQKVMEGYWDVEPVTSVSDKLNAKISDLRQKHKAAMQEAKDQNRQAIANERARSKAAIDAYAAQRDAIDKANKALYEAERDQMVQAYNRDMKALESQFGEDTRIMQKEFFRLLREYDKQSAKGEKTGARDAQTIQELRNQLKKEADSHKEDSAAWNREFNRLLREYDASGRQIDRLEAKVKHQQEAAKAKVENRKMTEARYKIERTAKELNRYLLHPTNTVHVPTAMQESVAKAMDALTMAISGRKGGINADRLSEYAYQLRELQKDPSGNAGKIADVQRKIQTLTERDARMQTAMADLKEQYQALQSSGDPAAAQIYDENVAAWIQDCLDVIGETEYRDMSLAQLESVQRVYRALLRRIQTANKAFREGKQATISEKVGRLTMEMDVKKKKVKTSGKAEKAVDQFFWNNLKPVYAFDRIGSGVMSELYENLRSGEDTWYNDVSAAKAFFLGTAAKYGYNTWDNENLMEFVSATGRKFQLNLEERMSLYAYSLREQARDHLKKGGIVLNENTERVAVGLLGVKRNMIYNDANAYNLTDETITAIGDSLTADQRAFAREMQQYLSTTMGAKGNEISRQLYDIDLFKEQFYWPLVSSKDYSARIKDAGENSAGNKIKNMGAAKPITPGASNPVVLSGFMDTWAGHVNQMSMYHAFTLPMEDFYRVYNWNSGSNENSQTKSTVQMLKDVYGDGATNYIDQFLKDLNGGLRADPRATVGRAMLSRFKKSAVFASASVAIQQPSAIGRAFSVIDPKYFVGSKVENAGESWEQCKKYAPIAGLKEMGRFDMDMGRSTIDYITAREYTGFREKAAGFLTDADYRDEIIGKAPELADQITWCAMWEAAKRQTAAKNPNLTGEGLLTQAGKLFTDCITRTQVYDSVFSRSANMRSKDTGMAMVTSFMAEPTTSINMIENAVRQWSRGYKMNAAKAVTSVLASVMINSALVSLVYAARNKDEDKTYWEKYLASLTGELMEGVNPITYIPYARDVWNMLQGYDVERSDMSLAADAVKALNKIVKVASKYPADGNEEQQQAWLKSLGDACWTGADGVASILGIPEKNIRRDIVAVMNLFKDSNWGESDSGTIKDAIAEAAKDATPIWNQIPDESRETKLYKAIIGGTPAQLHRLQNKYNTPKELENAVVKALRLKDPRILQAAEAHAAGDDQTRLRIAKEIIAEKHFTQNQVVAAINAEVSRIYSEGKTASDKIKEQSLYYTEDYIDAMTAGLGNTDAIRQEIIRAKVANSDKEQEEAIASAERSFMYAVKDTAKDQFLDGDLSMEQTEKILKSVGVYDGDEEDIHRNVYAWQISEELGGKYDWSVSQYLDWKEVIAPSGFFTPDTYDNYLTGVGNVHGEDLNGDGKTDMYSKTKAMARYINSLPLTNEQKDFLFALAYPNINTQKKYKLW